MSLFSRVTRVFLQQPTAPSPTFNDIPSQAQKFDHTLTVLGLDGDIHIDNFLQTLVNSFPPPPSPQTARSIPRSILGYLLSPTPATHPFEIQMSTPIIGVNCWHTHSGTTRLFALQLGGCRPTGLYKVEAGYYQDATALIWLLQDTPDDRLRFAEMREELGHAIRGVRDTRGKVPVVFFVNQSTPKDGEKERVRSFDRDDLRIQVERPDVLGNRDWNVFWGDLRTGRGMSDAVDWLNCCFRMRGEKAILPIRTTIGIDHIEADEKTLVGKEEKYFSK